MSKPLVVITGASSGIGEAVARQFSKEGHPLLLLARRLDRLEALDLPNALCRKVDVTNRAELVAVLATLKWQNRFRANADIWIDAKFVGFWPGPYP